MIAISVSKQILCKRGRGTEYCVMLLAYIIQNRLFGVLRGKCLKVNRRSPNYRTPFILGGRMQQEIDMLEKEIKRNQHLYYEETAVLSDDAYDAIVDRLRLLKPDSPVLANVGTPSIGTKTKHIMPMGSQNKAANKDEFMLWPEEGPFVVEDKLDGASLELQYVNGVIFAAVTRGDGLKGDNILSNALLMKGVPRTVDRSIRGVRGEVVITSTDFDSMPNKGKNARNSAVGTMKRKDGEGCQYLTFIAYDIEEDTPCDTEINVLIKLMSAGFLIPMYIRAETKEEVIMHRMTRYGERDEGQIPYDVDGLVIKPFLRDKADRALPRPKRQIAFKYPLDTAASKLLGIEWSQSGKTFTPVAIFEPVELNGTTVQRASLANMSVMQELDIVVGCTVIIKKCGEIIPKVESAIHTDAHHEVFIPPMECPTCKTVTKMEGAFLICPNKKCPEVLAQRFIKWFDTMEIKGVGPAIAKGFALKYPSITHLYKEAYLTIEDATYVSRETSENVLKLFKSIVAKKDCTFPQFIAGFSLDGIGQSTIESIQSAGYTTISQLLAMDLLATDSIPGVGHITLEALQSGITDNLEDMLGMQQYITCHSALATGSMTGEVIVFTGEMHTMKRAEAEELVRGAGGQTKSSVVKNTTYLVTNDTTSGSSKNKKAAELGIPIITEDQFIAWSKGGVKP